MRGAVVLNEAQLEDVRCVPVLLAVILVVIVFFLPARSPGMQLLTTEFMERQLAPSDTVDARCRTVACARGLTVRETEVMTLLARGRSIPYIAETLYLTENTVKTYRQRIYAKLEIHSRQDLLDLVDAADGNRGGVAAQ